MSIYDRSPGENPGNDLVHQVSTTPGFSLNGGVQFSGSENRLPGIAAWLARKGYHVFPLQDGGKIPRGSCSDCREQKHTPADCECIKTGGVCHGYCAATSSLDQVQQWWRRWPHANVGVATGPSRLVVVDIDTHSTQRPAAVLPGQVEPTPDGVHDGLDVWTWLVETHQASWSPADSLTVTTPTGGLHIWYTTRRRDAIQSSKGSDETGLGWSIDVRASGGYVVAPGCVRPEGVYTRISDTTEPASLPGWLAAALGRAGQNVRTRPVQPPSVSHIKDASRYALAALDGEVQQLTRIPPQEGSGWNDQLNRSAFAISRFVQSGELGYDEAFSTLLNAAMYSAATAPHRKESAARATIKSGLAGGARKHTGGAR